jgi:hypothetical protein
LKEQAPMFYSSEKYFCSKAILFKKGYDCFVQESLLQQLAISDKHKTW